MNPYRFTFDATQKSPVQGGIGSCCHAIPGPFESHAGSAWGATPPPEDDAAWAEVYRHADLLALGWNRISIEEAMYQPERGRYDWDTLGMRTLYRLLDWCESRHAEVFLMQMWTNNAWNAHPGILPHRSAPVHLDAFAEGLSALVDHLIRTRGYTCLRWLGVTNEPAEEWSWWMNAEGKLDPVTPAKKAVREALDRRGLTLPIAGPDWTHLPACDPAKIDFDDYVGAYELHTYFEQFHHAEIGQSAAEKILCDWAQRGKEKGKPFLLGEIGCMVYGWQYDHPAPGGYLSGLKLAEVVIRGLHCGVDAFARWSFLNQGNLDGQWQLLDTWNPATNTMLPTEQFRPHANSYTIYSLLTRFFALNSQRIPVAIKTEKDQMGHYALAAALLSPTGELTILALNNTAQDVPATFDLTTLFATDGTAKKLWRYRVTQVDADRPGHIVAADSSVDVSAASPAFSELLPGLSLTVYSTLLLAPDQPGLI